MKALYDFFYMNGHGVYVFSAYGSVLTFLMVQWFIPWRRFRNYLRKELKKSAHE
jgi:heme exporter protein D